MKQEAMNVLLTRRSVRQYQTRQVSEQEMDQVLQAGLYAPTGKNVQGVELVAVQEKELRDRLAALMSRNRIRVKERDGKSETGKGRESQSYQGKQRTSMRRPPRRGRALSSSTRTAARGSSGGFLYS